MLSLKGSYGVLGLDLEFSLVNFCPCLMGFRSRILTLSVTKNKVTHFPFKQVVVEDCCRNPLPEEKDHFFLFTCCSAAPWW